MFRLDNPAVYQKDMYKATFREAKSAPQVYKTIFKFVPGAEGAGDKETQLLGMGDLDRHTTENQGINFTSPTEGWTYYTKFHTFSGGLSLSFEAVEDSIKLGKFLDKYAATWQRSKEHACETLAAGVFNDGGTLSGNYVFNGSWLDNTDPSGDLMYDSSPMFCLSGNEYTHKGGGTYYNSIAGLSLSASTFEQVYNLHTATNAKDELDRPSVEDVDTLLTRRGADYLMAKRIMSATQGLPGGQLNDPNVYAGLALPVEWAYLTDTAFYVGKRQSENLQFIERMAPRVRFFRNEQTAGYDATYMYRFGVSLKGRPFTRGGGSSAA